MNNFREPSGLVVPSMLEENADQVQVAVAITGQRHVSMHRMNVNQVFMPEPST